jgi:hypothetical protein
VKKLAILVALLCLASLAVAQSTSGTITGRVTDPSKAVVPSAKVVLINTSTNNLQTVTTDAVGSYHLANVQPGNYRMEIEKQGFRTIIKPAITLHVQDALEINFEMAVGATSETVTVEGGAPLLDTESATVGTVVDRNFVDNMPLNGRSFQTLIQLTPGVVTTAASFASPGQFSANGQRAESNYFTVDGVSANISSTSGAGALDYGAGAFPGLTASGGTNNLVSVDALQEFRIQTSTFAPEFGRTPGAQVSILTRSGGNQFHGSVYEYLRNDVLDAADWFTNNLNQKKPALRQNDFGGTLSGPVLRDKLFFFFSYEGLRLRLPKTQSRDVPSLATRTNAVPEMRPFLNSFPMPTGPDHGDGLATFIGGFSDPSTLNATSLRMDYNLSDKWKLFARYNHAPSSSATRGVEASALNDVWVFNTKTQTATVGATYAISPRLVNDFRYNYSRVSNSNISHLDTLGGAVPFDPSLTFPSGFTPKNSAMIFGLFFGDVPLHALGNITTSKQRQNNIVDGLTWVQGQHQFKFGMDYRRLSPVVDPPHYLQQVLFGLLTGDASGTLSGVADYVAKVSAQSNQNFVYDNYSLFGQDTWKLTPNTTLTYGLRWDYNPTPHVGEGMPQPYTLAGIQNYQQFDASVPLTFAPQGTPIYHASRQNFAPRIGIAQRISGSQTWGSTLRGGFGIFYDLGNTPAGSITGFPYSSSTAAVFVPFPLSGAAAAPPVLGDTTPPIGSLTVIDSKLKTPYTLQWNAAFEQQLGATQSLTMTYVGAVGRNLLRTAYYDGINPDFSSIQIFSNGGESNYNALQTQYQRNLSRGLQVLASYTWGHSIDTESAGQGAQPPARASSDFDIRHTFSAAVSYEIPKPTWNAFSSALLGGWSAHSMVIARSAAPVELVAAFPALPFSFVARPDVVPGQPFYISDNTVPGGKRFNPDAFAFPAPDQQGNLPRNALRGFGATQVDLSIQRFFKVREPFGLRFRADVFNLFNHPNFGPPDRRLYSTKFGVATQTLAQSLGSGGADAGFSPLYQIGGPRSIQVSLRIEF